MKVILLENVTSVGALGEVINVRPGYARNYLFPQGKAERADEAAIARFEQRRSELQKRQEEVESAMTKARQTLDGYILQLATRASPDGNLYGSITPQMIAGALNEQKLLGDLPIKRGQISLTDGGIKALGEHAATVRVGAGIEATITISVMAETASAAAAVSHSSKETKNDPSSADNAQKDAQ